MGTNRKPVSYLQTDARWRAKRYPCVGGTMSLGGGGCGPTCAAMLIETLTGAPCPPTATMEWACRRGYVTAGQGTQYAYFRAQLARFGIDCALLTQTPCLSAASPVRREVERLLGEGYYFVALMKPGLWTGGGHYVLVWDADERVRILDPASTAEARTNGDPDAFFAQAKYFWSVDARDYNRRDEEETMKRYDTLEEIETSAPWAAETVRKLIERGALSGTGTGLDLSADLLRAFVVNDRMGLYR